MRRGSLLQVLTVAGFSVAAALAQQIVIEPTNGRPASATQHVARPAAVDAKQEAKPLKSQSSAPKSTAKRHPEKQTAAKAKTAPAAEVAKIESRETVPVPATVVAPTTKYPARPAWALNDTRDAHSLEAEIANALSHDAMLKGSAIQVKVDDDAVTLLGRAAGSEERLQAERLTQSYAWNRKVVDKIEVTPRVSAQR